MSSGLTMRQQSAGMNVGAPTSARFGQSGFAAFSENGPTLAFVGVTGKVRHLAGRAACQM